jgi:hypothetical protein
LSFFSVFKITHISREEKLSTPFTKLLSLKFILNLKSASIKGKKVISYCLNKAINKAIHKIIIVGIKAISHQVFGSRELKTQ